MLGRADAGLHELQEEVHADTCPTATVPHGTFLTPAMDKMLSLKTGIDLVILLITTVTTVLELQFRTRGLSSTSVLRRTENLRSDCLGNLTCGCLCKQPCGKNVRFLILNFIVNKHLITEL